MSRSDDFERVDGFVAGTIGVPGQRTFYLSIQADGRTLNLKAEKQQVAALADYLERVVDAVGVGGTATAAPHAAPQSFDWTVGALAVAVAERSGEIIVTIEELVLPSFDADLTGPEIPGGIAEAGTDEHGPASVQFVLTPPQARAFSQAANELTADGRPICELCYLPMDPAGHDCPRLN